MRNTANNHSIEYFFAGIYQGYLITIEEFTSKHDKFILVWMSCQGHITSGEKNKEKLETNGLLKFFHHFHVFISFHLCGRMN